MGGTGRRGGSSNGGLGWVNRASVGAIVPLKNREAVRSVAPEAAEVPFGVAAGCVTAVGLSATLLAAFWSGWTEFGWTRSGKALSPWFRARACFRLQPAYSHVAAGLDFALVFQSQPTSAVGLQLTRLWDPFEVLFGFQEVRGDPSVDRIGGRVFRGRGRKGRDLGLAGWLGLAAEEARSAHVGPG